MTYSQRLKSGKTAVAIATTMKIRKPIAKMLSILRLSAGRTQELLEITPDIIKRYTQGQCHYLALAIYEETGWTIANIDWGMHIFVIMPDGDCLDIEGVCSQAEMKQRWKADSLEIFDKPKIERAIRTWGIKPDTALLLDAKEYVPAVLALAALNIHA